MEYKDYTKLRWKLIAMTLGFSLVPLFVLGWNIYYQFHVSYTEKIRDNLKTLAENRRSSIDLFLDERASQLMTLAYTHSFEELRHKERLDKVFNLMQARAKSFVDMGIIDGDGNHVSYVGPYELMGVNYKDEEWFNAVMIRGIHISDVFMGFREFPHFVIAVRRREDDRSWILRATIDTDIFESMVKAARLGLLGDAYVINREGVLQTRTRFGDGVLTPSVAPPGPRFAGVEIRQRSNSRESLLEANVWLEKKDWMLVVKEDIREELSPLLQARHMVIGIVLGGVLAVTTGAFLVTRSIVDRMVKTDREKALLDASLVQSSKMAALGKLAAGIAHEVNNPLAVIKEKVGWMKDLLSEEDVAGSENFKELEDSLRKIDLHVERARKVTHRFLGFARRMEPVREEVDVNRVLTETLEFLANEALNRNIAVETELSDRLPLIRSDSSQLQQVFLNILNNAIDAIGRDGSIAVRSALASGEKPLLDRIFDPFFKEAEEQGEVVVTLSDTGSGISPSIQDKIFDPFFTTKELGSGTGLGLSISYAIVEKLGGRMMVASEEGRGTTFTIHLPVQPPLEGA